MLCAAIMTTELPHTLRTLMNDNLLSPEVGYGKSELIERLSLRVGARAAEVLFLQLRRHVTRGDELGVGIQVRTTGARRGLKYVFSDAAEDSRAGPNEVASTRSVQVVERSDPQPSINSSQGRVRVCFGGNLEFLTMFPSESFRMIYVDPPFNTGRKQARKRLRTVRDEDGDRVGFKGHRYRTTTLGSKSFDDSFDDYLGFLAPRLEQAHRLLTSDGSLFVHLDYREVHYAKVLLDQIFGRECFMNELIWAYDYGARSKRKWSAKHDSILWYVKDPRRYVFNYDAMDRIPYMAPGLVGAEKAARGKTPTDVWWHTIVSPNGREKTGYPTQKPCGVVRRIVEVHSEPGDALLDFFAGSGTLGEVGAELGRDVTLIDNNPEALEVMRNRLERFNPDIVGDVAAGAAEQSAARKLCTGQVELFR